MDSCHHRSWLQSVPRSQLLRLHRNCTDKETFKVQANVLKTRFLDKGYNPNEVDCELQCALEINRESLLEVRSKQDSENNLKRAMMTSFSTQHRQIKAIFAKH